jgi:tetratricopeptide (TPR) repeat protein
MVDPTPSDYNLTYLRERWDRDRSSRIFLQLAEEYRRRGLHAEALEVLETGLGHHPGYLAAQVALGRCRLDAGQAAEAVKVVEKVLTQDPTQAVATRLLAESWLALGDEERAQAAIDRCRLIGMPPSEIVSLEQRLAAARRAARERWAEPAAAPAEQPVARSAPEPVEEAPLPWAEAAEPELAAAPPMTPAASVPAAPSAPAPLEAASPRAAASPPSPAMVPAPAPPPKAEPPRAEPAAKQPAAASAMAAPPSPAPRPPQAAAEAADARVFHLPPAPRGVVLPLRPAGERRLIGGQRAEPFGPAARRRPAAAPQGEVFRLVPPPVAELTAAPADRPLVAPVAVAPTPTAAAKGTAAQPTGGRWWDRPAEPSAPAATPPPATPVTPISAPAPRAPETPAPPSPHVVEVPAPAVAAAPSAPPPSPPSIVEFAAPAAPAAAPAPPAAPPRPALAERAGVELQPSGIIDVPELRPSDPGTATLGELYLRQGYVREAEDIFRQVLARDADNEAALAGLEAIGRRRAQKLTAAELLTGVEDEDARGLTARKIQLLTRYLRTLKRGAVTDVPRTAQ